jgi:hypothetical protein
MVFRVSPAPLRTLVSWWDEKDDIDLDPVYQRKGHIWSLKQKQDLIDTVLNGFDIPKLYFADFTILNSSLNAKKKKYTVIDGKQRMLAFFGFFEGDFTLSNTFYIFETPGLKLGGLAYKDLVTNHPKIARRFENGQLAIVSVETDDEQKINELFIRLNTSKPLVGAEIRNAMLGEVPKLIRDLADHPFWARTRFNKQRGQDKNTAAKLLLLEHAGTFVDTKRRHLDQLVSKTNQQAANQDDQDGYDDDPDVTTDDEIVNAAVDAENTDIGRSAERVKATLSLLAPLFIDNDQLLAQQAMIPVIYWLARDLEPSDLTALRAFLQQFGEERLANRKRQIDDPARDLTLNHFELMARSSNDQHSISERHRIMYERFEKFRLAASFEKH